MCAGCGAAGGGVSDVKATVIQFDGVAFDKGMIRGKEHTIVPGAIRPKRKNRRTGFVLTSPVDAVTAGDQFDEDGSIVFSVGDAEDPEEANVH